VAGDPRAQIVISAERLNNTRREELLRQLDELQAAVGCEWSDTRVLEKKSKMLKHRQGLRGLENNDVSCE
jgi:hypothetical protein